jgi:hypothetical protein
MANHKSNRGRNGLSSAYRGLGNHLKVESCAGADGVPRQRGRVRLLETDFSLHGALCWRVNQIESFNFRQRWTLIPGVAMATSARDPAALSTLALNLLEQFFRRASVRLGTSPDPRALRLMAPFAAEMLAPLEFSAWHLPIESINEWLSANIKAIRSSPYNFRRPLQS